MRKTRFLLFVIFLLFSIPLFSGCPLENLFISIPKELDFEISGDDIVPNEPVEVIVRLCYKRITEETVYAIQILDKMKAVPIEGNLLESQVDNARVLEFIEPEEQTNNEEEQDTSYPYCKLQLEFSECGIYEICIKRADKDFAQVDFTDGCIIRYRITVG